jgi:Mce-associated membrane protein
VSGVLSGLRGTPPPARPDEDETTVLPRITDEDVLSEPEPELDLDDEVETEVDPETNEPPAVPDDEEPVRKPRPVKAPARPAGKRRSTGSARPTDLAEAESDAGDDRRRSRRAKAEAAPVRTKAQTQMSVAVILVVVAVVLAGLAVFFRGKANDLNSGDSNTALTDSATTSQLKGQLTNAIKLTFSYNYTDLASTEKAVKENLTGKALCNYNLLFGEVKQQAPQQKIVLDTTVRDLAIVRIDGDRAEALVYIDQLSTRVDVNKTVAAGGQFAVQAKRDGDHWKITDFDMFDQPLINGKPAPKC